MHFPDKCSIVEGEVVRVAVPGCVIASSKENNKLTDRNCHENENSHLFADVEISLSVEIMR
jgi:hypothetical protein